MGILAERLEHMVVHASSPDRCINAVLTYPQQLTLTFTAGSYRQYREQYLERQLNALASRLWIAYRRGYLAALNEAIGEPEQSGLPADETELPRSREPETDPHVRRYREAAAAIVAHGESADKRVRVSTTALVRWEFSISPGTVDTVSENQCRQDVLDAAQKAINDFRAQVRDLKTEYYGRPETRISDPWVTGRISW